MFKWMRSKWDKFKARCKNAWAAAKAEYDRSMAEDEQNEEGDEEEPPLGRC